MPTIAAGSYPIENIPAVAPQAAQGDFQHIEVNPEAFGAGIGVAESHLGGAIGQASNEIEKQALERQDLYNNTTADQQTNNWLDQANKIQYGDPNNPGDKGFYGLQGEDAMRAFPVARDALTTSRAAAGATLNPIARLKFENESRRLESYMLNSMGAHYDRELTSYGMATAKGKQALGAQMTNAGASTGNDDQFFAGMKMQEDAVREHARLQGLGEEAIAPQINEVRSNAVKAKAYSMAVTDPLQGLQFVERHADMFVDKNEYFQLHGVLEQKSKDMRANINAGLIPAPDGWDGGKVEPRALIPHTPSQDFLNGTGMSAQQYDTFRHYLASREAGSYDEAPNAGGYAGQYQMGKQEIADAAGRLNIPVPTQQQYLNSPELQEQLFENYTLDHHNHLMTQSDRYRNASPQERAAILAGAHLGGVAGVQNYLNNGKDAADSNGTHISDYVNSMRGVMQGTTSQPQYTIPKTITDVPGNLEVWGDSLGVGLAASLKSPAGTVHGGDNPTTILNNIKAIDPKSWSGKTVVLSSGSNGNQMPVVEDTIKYLQDNGAKVIATGYGPKFPQKNADLREIAGRLGVPVVDTQDVGVSEGVHPAPSGYNKMSQNILHYASNIDQNVTPVTPGARAMPIPPPDALLGELPDNEVPGLQDHIAEIQQRIASETGRSETQKLQDFQEAVKARRKADNAAWQQQQRELTNHKNLEAAQSDAAEKQLMPRIYQGSSNLPTPEEIAKNPYLSNAAKEKLNAFVTRVGKEEPAPPQDKANTVKLFAGISAPYGDPSKIVNPDQIDKAYLNGDISKANHEWLTKKMEEHKTTTGATLAQTREQFFKGFEFQTRGPKDAMGNYTDPAGGEREYNFRQWAQQKEDEYVKAGKDPLTLYNPSSPDYIAKNGPPKEFRATMATGTAVVHPPATPGQLPTGDWDRSDMSDDERRTALKAAVASGTLTREQAIGMSHKLGLTVAPGAQAPVAQ